MATEKLFDMTGQVDYSFLALFSLWSGGDGTSRSFRQWVVTLFVLLWSARLGVFLYRRIQRTKKDGRFDEIKHHVPRFFNMWTIQGSIHADSRCFHAVFTPMNADLMLFRLLGLPHDAPRLLPQRHTRRGILPHLVGLLWDHPLRLWLRLRGDRG